MALQKIVLETDVSDFGGRLGIDMRWGIVASCSRQKHVGVHNKSNQGAQTSVLALGLLCALLGQDKDDAQTISLLKSR